MMVAEPELSGKLFLGHPRGLLFLAMTEAWERFSFYGMRTLLILYMVQELLLSDDPGRIAGMVGFRSALESLLGPMSTQAFASQTFGLYAGFVYFTPLFGGLIADRWLGARKTVMIGIVLMTLGHFAMAFDWSFLIALLLLVLGSGCLKGNIAAQVGHLYPKQDEERRSSGYTIFSTGINVGAVIGPLVCGTVAQFWGWHAGFGLAGFVMLIAAVVYFSGMKHFADDRPASKGGADHPPMTRKDWRVVWLIVAMLAIYVLQSFSYDQLFNVGLIWIAERVALGVGGFDVPVPWFGSEDSLASIVVVPLLIGFYAWLSRKGYRADDIDKINMGAAVMALSTLCLAAGSWLAGDGKVAIAWPILAFFLSGVSFMLAWPTALALVSRRAPAQISALMMAGTYLIAFFTNVGSGYFARWYEPMGDVNFWLFQTGLTVVGLVVMLLFAGSFRRKMAEFDARRSSMEVQI